MSRKKCNTPQKRKLKTKVRLRSSTKREKEKTQATQADPKATLAISRACYICGRDWKQLQMIGPTTFRCIDCFLGSYEWIEFWQAMPRKERPDIINWYFDGGYHEKK